MSIESAKAFIERMKTDEEFAKNVMVCKDADTFRSLVQAAGFEFNDEEIREVTGVISNDDLANVAGGVNCPYVPDCLDIWRVI
jgi:predicted ribosomally synthesized peptide with nif11-like leader